MASCPNCSRALSRVKTPWGNVYACRECGGRMVAFAVMRRDHAAQPFLSVLWQGARASKDAPGSRLCPHCRLPMPEIEMPQQFGGVRLDVCTHCHGAWFDPTEYKAVPHVDEKRPIEKMKELSLPAREAVARMRLERLKTEDAARDDRSEGPDEAWKLVPAVLGMPVEVDVPATANWPLVTWTVAGLIVAFFLASIGNFEEVVKGWGFVPASWARHGGLTLLTSFFLHGGGLHLIGNLYFLLVFGDNVEDRLGKARFLLLLLGAHLAGMVLHGLFDPRGGIPCVGASAGICGVLAYYAVSFPRARLAFFIITIYRSGWLRLPAWFFFVLFLILQFVEAYEQVGGFTNVSALAHLGGIAVGLVAAFVSRVTRVPGDGPSEKRGSE